MQLAHLNICAGNQAADEEVDYPKAAVLWGSWVCNRHRWPLQLQVLVFEFSWPPCQTCDWRSLQMVQPSSIFTWDALDPSYACYILSEFLTPIIHCRTILEKEMAIHSSTLPWEDREEYLSSLGQISLAGYSTGCKAERVRHDWAYFMPLSLEVIGIILLESETENLKSGSEGYCNKKLKPWH